jgi:hypothetical protein
MPAGLPARSPGRTDQALFPVGAKGGSGQSARINVVTDRRIVLADRFSGRTRTSAYLGTLPPPVVRIRRDGSGTIVFGGFSRVPVMPSPSSGPCW